MSDSAIHVLMRHLHRLASPNAVGTTGDRQLLERFSIQRDQDAFSTLVSRYGPVVFGVCQRVLSHRQDAEDAFQKTFLILARKAGSLHQPDGLPAWLHGVAYRVARQAAARRRPSCTAPLAETPAPSAGPEAEAAGRELQRLLDEELQRLSSSCRSALVLCYLEGLSRDQAAQRLGWSLGTLKRRLESGRRLLRDRLARRGVGPGVDALAPSGLAPVPPVVLGKAVCAAVADGAAHALTKGAAIMALAKSKIVLAATLVIGVGLAAGVGVGVGRRALEKPAAAQAGPPPAPRAKEKAPELTDLYGDPLPSGAVGRFGTVRLRAQANSLAISPDGRTLISIGQGVIREWDAATGAPGSSHPLPSGYLPQTFLSLDGKTVFVQDLDGVALWDAASGKERIRLPLGEHGKRVVVNFSADGRTLVMANSTSTPSIRLWNVADGKERLLTELVSPVKTLAIAPDGKRIVAAGEDGIRRCWDADNGKELWHDKAETERLYFSPGGRMILSKSYSPSASFHLWDAMTGRPADHGNPPPVNGTMLFSPDGDVLAIVTSDGVVIWDLKTDKERRRFPKASGPLVFSPDGKTLTGQVGQVLQRWNLVTGETLYPDTHAQGHLAPVEAVAYSHDGKLLATVAADKSVRIWDVASRKLLKLLPGAEGYGWALAAFTPDGATLVTGGYDGTVRFWDVHEGKEVRRLEARDIGDERNAKNDHSYLSADGKTLITVRPDFDPTGRVAMLGAPGTGTLTVWDAATGKQRSRRKVPNPKHSDVFSADGRWMAVVSGAVYDTATGERRLTLKADHGVGTPFGDAFAFSQDGALVAGILWENTVNGIHHRTEPRGIQIWELATGAPVARIPTKEFCRFAFSPNGRTLATVGPDAIQLWDVVSARELYSQAVADHLLAPNGATFAFAPDGRSIAVAATDTTVLVWDLSSGYAVAPAAPALDAAKADGLWADLAGADAAKAYAAVNRLAARPAESVALLRERLRAVAPIPAERVSKWVAELNDDDLTVRDAATRQLAAVGDQVKRALGETLTHDISAEQRQRIKELLEGARLLRPGDALRGLRAVRVLEYIDSKDGRLVLKTLAAGDPDSAVTQEAKDALTRGAGAK
jgi:RNA polymerase sigma factor (sigma-70 family)